MLAAGNLNDRINIEQRTSVQDAVGQAIETWTLVAAVWANVAHPSGLSGIRAGSDVSLVQASIRIRYRSGLDAGMRVVFGIEIYDIKAVLPNRKAGFTDLVCELVK